AGGSSSSSRASSRPRRGARGSIGGRSGCGACAGSGRGDLRARMSRPVVIPIEDAPDLHAFAPREIPSVVESYLEAAVEAGVREVRLVHGRRRGVPLPEVLAGERAGEACWRYRGEAWHLICAAEPNAAHAALADLARAGRIDLLVTQNVDGLHERSGFPPERLVNIHGTDSAVECMACHRRAPRAVAQAVWEAGMAVPRCDCGGPWKPATISFGQQLVAVDLERALDAAAACDLFVAAGTSLVVGPVNQMFPVARQAGARTAIVTASETPYDAAADVRIAAPVEQVLPAVRDQIR